MSYFLIYLIKSTVYLGLFYAFFLVAMRKTTFFRFNRWMLLVGTLACMLLPCHTITVEEVEGIQLPMQVLDEMLVLKATSEEVQPMSEATLSIQETETNAPAPLLPYLLTTIYALGAIIYLIMVIRSFVEVWRLIARHPKQWKDGCWLIVLPDKVPSVSWSNYIIISEEDYRLYPQVLVHERMHYQCRHSYDILFMTIVHALHWFNPMVWLIRTELKQLHEFEADEGVINQGIDATQYQLLLVKKAVGKKLYTIANGFNHTKLQKRITMMIQEKSNRWERLKWLVVVPIVAGAVLLFTEVEEKQLESLDSYKEYFKSEIKKYNFSKIRDANVHAFTMDNDNKAHFKDKHIHSPKEVKAALADVLAMIERSTEKEMHCIGFSYEAYTDRTLVSSYLNEIKEIYKNKKLTPLVFINEPSHAHADQEGIKRYNGIEISLGDRQTPPLKNFTLQELSDAVKQTLHTLSQDEYIRIGFRATKNQRMENVNEVRRLLRDLYKPQQVIFSQTVLND